MRLMPLMLFAAALGSAPYQCGSGKSDDPDYQRYETPPEALYDLAERFGERGDAAARRATLEYLVERYPNSRYATMAKEDLAVEPGAATD